MSFASKQRLAQQLANLAQQTQPSVSSNGRKLVIVFKGNRYEIKQTRSSVVNEQVARLR